MQNNKQISDAAAAAAFRRLVAHLQHRHDAENIDLMGLTGFCRNCLADWVMEAQPELTKEEAREAINEIRRKRGIPPGGVVETHLIPEHIRQVHARA